MAGRRLAVGALVGAAGLAVLAVMALPERRDASQQAEQAGWTVVERAPRPAPAVERAVPAGEATPEVLAPVEAPAALDVRAVDTRSLAREPASPPRVERPRVAQEPQAAASTSPVAEPATRLGAKLLHGGRLAAFARRVAVGTAAAASFDFGAEFRRDGDVAFVALPESDTRLEGWLVEHAGGRAHLRGWFELPAGASDVTLAFGGRFVEVTLDGDERGELAVEAGPRPGWRPPAFPLGALEAGTASRVWVPHQAAALVVTAADGRRARAMLADGADALRVRLPARAR